MKRTAIFLAGVWLMATTLPASAAWKIDSYKDRMTDKAVRTPTLAAKSPDHGAAHL